MFLFPLLVATEGGWTVACLANTVLAVFPRHSALKGVIKRVLQQSDLPSDLDGASRVTPEWYAMTVLPYSGDRSLVWDWTYVDTFAGVNLTMSSMEAGTASNSTYERNRRKYGVLVDAHQFEPIAVETMGVYGGSTGLILRAIGSHLVEATGEPREANWLRQNLAIAGRSGSQTLPSSSLCY